MTDHEFFQDFSKQKITRESWTHEAHLRLGWILLQRYDFLKALYFARSGIQKLNSVIGAQTGYHETITQSYLLLINDAVQKNPVPTFEKFKMVYPSLLTTKMATLKKYFSDSLLWSAEARENFVTPDLKKLPLPGVIRNAKANDAAAILKIYAPYIEKSAVSFETVVPTQSEMQERIEEYSERGFLVYELDGKVIAYAYASKHRDRAAYQWSCEVTVYVADEWQGYGIAKTLYARLFTILREKNVANAFAGITLPNEKSVALHESLGFKSVGVFEKVGFKLERWHDVGWWGLRLASPG